MRKTAVLLSVVVLAMALAACQPYNAPSRFGVNVLNVPGARTPAANVVRMNQAGFKWARVFLWWAAMQPNGPANDPGEIAATDAIINNLYSNGFSILVSLGRTPRWAMAAPVSGAICPNDKTIGPPKDTQVFGTFAGAMVARYKDRVGAWELWNEPNGNCSFPGTPAQFRSRVLAPGFDAIKATDPHAIVVGPAANNVPDATELPAFWDNFYTYVDGNGVHRLVRPIDAFSVHGYGNVNSIENKIDAAAGYKRCTAGNTYCMTKFWLAEFGFNDPGCWTWYGCQNTDPAADTAKIFDHCAVKNDCVHALYWSADFDDYSGTTQLDSLGLIDPRTGVPRAKYAGIAAYIHGHPNG